MADIRAVGSVSALRSSQVSETSIKQTQSNLNQEVPISQSQDQSQSNSKSIQPIPDQITRFSEQTLLNRGFVKEGNKLIKYGEYKQKGDTQQTKFKDEIYTVSNGKVVQYEDYRIARDGDTKVRVIAKKNIYKYDNGNLSKWTRISYTDGEERRRIDYDFKENSKVTQRQEVKTLRQQELEKKTIEEKKTLQEEVYSKTAFGRELLAKKEKQVKSVKVTPIKSTGYEIGFIPETAQTLRRFDNETPSEFRKRVEVTKLNVTTQRETLLTKQAKVQAKKGLIYINDGKKVRGATQLEKLAIQKEINQGLILPTEISKAKTKVEPIEGDIREFFVMTPTGKQVIKIDKIEKPIIIDNRKKEGFPQSKNPIEKIQSSIIKVPETIKQSIGVKAGEYIVDMGGALVDMGASIVRGGTKFYGALPGEGLRLSKSIINKINIPPPSIINTTKLVFPETSKRIQRIVKFEEEIRVKPTELIYDKDVQAFGGVVAFGAIGSGALGKTAKFALENFVVPTMFGYETREFISNPTPERATNVLLLGIGTAYSFKKGSRSNVIFEEIQSELTKVSKGEVVPKGEYYPEIKGTTTKTKFDTKTKIRQKVKTTDFGDIIGELETPKLKITEVSGEKGITRIIRLKNYPGELTLFQPKGQNQAIGKFFYKGKQVKKFEFTPPPPKPKIQERIIDIPEPRVKPKVDITGNKLKKVEIIEQPFRIDFDKVTYEGLQTNFIQQEAKVKKVYRDIKKQPTVNIDKGKVTTPIKSVQRTKVELGYGEPILKKDIIEFKTLDVTDVNPKVYEQYTPETFVKKLAREGKITYIDKANFKSGFGVKDEPGLLGIYSKSKNMIAIKQGLKENIRIDTIRHELLHRAYPDFPEGVVETLGTIKSNFYLQKKVLRTVPIKEIRQPRVKATTQIKSDFVIKVGEKPKPIIKPKPKLNPREISRQLNQISREIKDITRMKYTLKENNKFLDVEKRYNELELKMSVLKSKRAVLMKEQGINFGEVNIKNRFADVAKQNKNAKTSSNIITETLPTTPNIIKVNIPPATPKPINKGIFSDIINIKNLVSNKVTSSGFSFIPIGVNKPLFEQRTPLIVDQRTPSLIDQRTPSILNQMTPTIIEQRTPSIVEQRTPSIVEQRTPSSIDQKTPSIIEQKVFSRVDQRTPSILEQKTTLINPTSTPILKPGIPDIPPPPPPPTGEGFLFPLINDRESKSNINKVKGYNVFAKVKGKYIKVNTKPLRKENAELMAKQVADRTVSQTSKIEPTNKRIKKNPIKSSSINLNNKFTRKGNVFKEKKKYAIDTPGEFRGITVKGWIAQKRKPFNIL